MMRPGRLWWLMRRDWRRGLAATWADYFVRPRIWRWRNPQAARPTEALPVHVLAGREHVDLVAWMLASWHHKTARNWRVVLHDDGSLRPADVARLQALFPALTALLRADADCQVAPALAGRPECAAYRRAHPLGLKIFDVPLLASTSRFILLDSDVLFFARPDAILAWADAPDDGSCWFNADVAEASNIPAAEMHAHFGCTLWSRVNSGLCLLSRATCDLDLCERALRESSIREGRAWRIEQTLFALCASARNRGGLLPAGYEVSLRRHRSPDAIARHYVGAVRDLFWAEGARALQRPLSLP